MTASVTGKPRNYQMKYLFEIEIGGVVSAAFMNCSELSAEIGEATVWEGGTIVAEKRPARVTLPDITMERGATFDLDLHKWMTDCANAVANAGLLLPDYERTFDIKVKDRDGTVLRRWRVRRAFVKKYVAGAWDNNTDEVTVESVTLAFHLFEPVAL